MDANILITAIVSLLQAVIPIIFGFAIIAFLWGVLKYGLSRDDKSRKESIAVIVNGIIILFVMVSVWGFVWFLIQFFGISDYSLLPEKPGSPGSLIVR